MKQLILLFIIISAAGVNSFAQVFADSCPKISVLGPTSSVRPGEPMTFYALVGNRLTNEYTFNWSLSAGTIMLGQGTNSINVDTSGLSTINVAATVEVAGDKLASTCENRASETGTIVALIHPRPSDQFGKLATGDLRQRIDNLFIELQNDPASEGWIVLYLKRTDSVLTKQKRVKLYADHVAFRKMAPSRFTFVITETEKENYTEFWIIPSDSKAIPFDERDVSSRLINGENLKKEVPKLFKKTTK